MFRAAAGLILGLSLVSATAQGANIVNGQRANSCEFPTTVALVSGGGLCTGTLVHPEIVLYAAHCGRNFGEVYFGEGQGSGAPSVATEYCQTFTGAASVGPSDYAFCKLAQPVTQIPITPVLFGCEVEGYIKAGQRAMIAGFGDAAAGGSAGTKRWAETTIAGLTRGMVAVGGDGVGAYQGDSGGPAYVQLEDGSWRAFGIVSGGNEPGQPVLYVRMETVVSWVEESSGVDITPCHNSDGAWESSDECGGFATTLVAPGTWSNWCADDSPVSGPSETCGDSYLPDDTPPYVAILNPADGDLFELAPSDVAIDVQVDDTSRIKRVWLQVDGQEIASLSAAPFSFAGSFPEGQYELVALAEDSKGNIGTSEPIIMFVGAAPGEEGGCACRTSQSPPPGGALILAGLGLITLRRRKR